MRSWLLLALTAGSLTACWTSPAPPPAAPTAYWIPPRPAEPTPTPIACAHFVEADPACASACPRDAPDDWTGCAALAAKLSTTGYICSSLHPRTCLPARMLPPPPCPPAGCAPVRARVVARSFVGDRIELSFTVDRNANVTTAWKAHVVMIAQDGSIVRVPDGEVTWIRATGSSNLAVGSIKRSVGLATWVYLEP